MSRRWHLVVVTVALLSTAGIARAAPSSNQALAQALFDEGKRLMTEGAFAQACPKLAESQRLDPSGGTLLHLAICHEGEGKTATAWTELNEAISVARRDGRADRETAAKARLALLTPKLTKLTIVVVPDARVDGLEVAWNGTAITEPQWSVPFPVDPGEHVITAAAPGRRKWSTRVKVEAGTSPVPVTIPALPAESSTGAGASPPPAAAAAPLASSPGTREEPPASSGSSMRTLGIALAGAGVVGLGAGAVFYFRTQSLADERDEAAANGDREGRDSKQDSAKTSQLIALLAGSFGVAALGTGLVLFVTAPKKAVAISPMMSPTAGGLIVGGSL
jgi:hypothetical protein